LRKPSWDAFRDESFPTPTMASVVPSVAESSSSIVLNTRPVTGKVRALNMAGRAAALLGAAGLALSGCGSSSGAPAPQSSSGGHLAGAGRADNVSNGSARVTLAPDVVEINRSDVANELTTVSPDGSTYTFNSGAGHVADLHSGSVMFLQGTSIRRVTAVSTSGGATVVTTAPASLVDAISSGTVKFTQPVVLAQGAIEPNAPTPPGDYVTTPSASPSAAAFRGTSPAAHLMSHIPSTTHYVDLSSLVTAPLPLAQLASVSRTIEGWDITMDFTPGNNRIDFTLTATRGQNPKATLSATGYIQNFIAEASFDVASGTMQNASFDASHLNGAVDFTWQASTDIGIGDHTLIHIPIKLEVPVIVGGIPFQIGIGAAFNAGFGFSSKNSTSGGGSKVTFGGDEGFKVDNSGQLTAQGAMQGIGQILSAIPTVTIAPAGFVIAIELPRLELGIGAFGTTAMGYVDVASSQGVSDAGALGVPCHGIILDVTGNAGVELSVLGFTINGAPKTEIFHQNSSTADPPGCAPGT
jgi:hypothetical protein